MEISCMVRPPASSFSLHNIRRFPVAGGRAALPRRWAASAAARRHEGDGRDYGGRLVDEDMVVLRKRLREMEIEEKGEVAAPPHWAEWEKVYYCGRYGDDICVVVAALQRILLRTRPAVALAVVALVAVGLPAAAAGLVFKLAAMVSVGLHIG